MDVCLISSDPTVREAVEKECAPQVSIAPVDASAWSTGEQQRRPQSEIDSRLCTADAVLVEFELLQASLLKSVRERVKSAQVPIVALTAGDPDEYATALLVGADAVVGLCLTPIMLKSIVVAHRRLLQESRAVASARPVEEDSALDSVPAPLSPTASENGQSARGERRKNGFRAAFSRSDACVVELLGTRIELSTIQFDLLRFLIEREEEIVTRDEILTTVWGLDADPGTNRVDVSVFYLRNTLREHGLPEVIETVHGKGYRFSFPAEPSKG